MVQVGITPCLSLLLDSQFNKMLIHPSHQMKSQTLICSKFKKIRQDKNEVLKNKLHNFGQVKLMTKDIEVIER